MNPKLEWAKKTYSSPRKKFKSHRQCTWTMPNGKQCPNKAHGYFFCKIHLISATDMDSGLESVEMGRLL